MSRAKAIKVELGLNWVRTEDDGDHEDEEVADWFCLRCQKRQAIDAPRYFVRYGREGDTAHCRPCARSVAPPGWSDPLASLG